MKNSFLNRMLSTSISLLVIGASAQSLTPTNSLVSLMPDKIEGRTPEEKQRTLEAMLATPEGQRRWEKMKQQQRAKLFQSRAVKINGIETRRDQVHGSITQKIVPNYGEILAAGERFGISPDILIASILSENSLATSNTDAIQEGLSGAVKLVDFGGKVHSKYTGYEEKMKSAKAQACKGLPASQIFLCLTPIIGEPSIPGWGRSYGPAQIDMITAASIADEPGVFNQVIEDQLIPGAFGQRPATWAETFQVLDLQLHSMRGAVNIIAANMAMASRYYAEKGWDIHDNMSVLVTLQRIGKISQRAEGIPSLGQGDYYPGADTFGVYAIAMKENGIIALVHQAAAGKIPARDLRAQINARLP